MNTMVVVDVLLIRHDCPWQITSTKYGN